MVSLISAWGGRNVSVCLFTLTMARQHPHKTLGWCFLTGSNRLASVFPAAAPSKSEHRWIGTTSETPTRHFPLKLQVTRQAITVAKANNNAEHKTLGMQGDSIISDYTAGVSTCCITLRFIWSGMIYGSLFHSQHVDFVCRQSELCGPPVHKILTVIAVKLP